MIKEDNQSDKHLTVAGLTVLGDVQSANLQRFEKNLQETFDKTQNLTAQQKEFWKNLADDNLITPVEKKQIKQEIAIIEKTYQAIHKKAQEVSQEFNPLFTSYATAYRELKDYITELKLFDNMNENTRVNKTEFNLKFSDYYELENVVQSVFLGTPTYTMRVLASLNDLGKEGEVAIYRNTFYRWESDRWVLVSGNTYLGKLNALPTVGSYGDFFLAETDFTGYVKYKANGKFLKSNGKFLATTKKFKKGFIYKLTVTGWEIVENKNDHRYVIATEDLIEIGEKISTNLQDYITDRAPKYLGALTEIPEEKTKGDYFTWATESTTEYVQGKVYMWNGEAWKPLDPRDTTNNQQFMTALTDILKTNATGEGYFSTVFTDSLIAHTAFIEELAATKAFIEKLQSQIITLQNGGRIQSENYEQGKLGFLLDSNGVFECSVGTFRGSIESGPLVLNTTSPGVSSFSFSPSDTVLTLYTKLKSYGINESVDTIKVNNESEVVKLEESSTTTNEPEICYFRTNKEFYGTVYIIEQWEKQTTTEKKTVILKNSNRTLTYVRTHSIHTKRIKEISQQAEEPSYPKRDTRGTVKVQDPSINQTLAFVINQNATTFKLLYLPVNTGNLTTGTVYVENGFLKIV